MIKKIIKIELRMIIIVEFSLFQGKSKIPKLRHTESLESVRMEKES